MVTDLFDSVYLPPVVRRAGESDYLVVVLHGKGDSVKPFLQFQADVNLKATPFLLLNAPRKYMGGYSWYGEPPYQNSGVLRARQRMNLLLQQLESKGWPSRKIFLVGFSQGCLVSTDVALHYPDRFAGVIGVSGYFNFEPRWRQNLTAAALKTPWLMTHGRQDDVLPIENTKLGVRKLRALGMSIEWHEFNKKHTFEEEDEKAIHTWIREQMRGPRPQGSKYLLDALQL